MGVVEQPRKAKNNINKGMKYLKNHNDTMIWISKKKSTLMISTGPKRTLFSPSLLITKEINPRVAEKEMVCASIYPDICVEMNKSSIDPRKNIILANE